MKGLDDVESQRRREQFDQARAILDDVLSSGIDSVIETYSDLVPEDLEQKVWQIAKIIKQDNEVQQLLWVKFSQLKK